MEKINISELGDRVIKSCDVSIDLRTPIRTEDDGLLYRTTDNKIVKVFSNAYIDNDDKRNGFYQKIIFNKLLEPTEIKGVVTPSKVMVNHNVIIGFTMDNISGVDDISYENNLEPTVRNNLHRIAQKYQELENIIRDAGDNIVFPSLLDRQSMIIDEHERINLINYDNIQVDDQIALSRAKSLSHKGLVSPAEKYYKTPSIKREGPYYTKELDKKSLIHYFLLLAFDLDISQMPYQAICNEALGGVDLDKELFDKIMSIYSSLSTDYIGSDLKRIADNYNLVDCHRKDNGMTRKLVRK